MRPAFVEALPVGKFHGVGPATTAKMNRLGIENGLDLGAQTISFLQQHFGKSGPYFYWIARGIESQNLKEKSRTDCASTRCSALHRMGDTGARLALHVLPLPDRSHKDAQRGLLHL